MKTILWALCDTPPTGYDTMYGKYKLFHNIEAVRAHAGNDTHLKYAYRIELWSLSRVSLVIDLMHNRIAWSILSAYERRGEHLESRVVHELAINAMSDEKRAEYEKELRQDMREAAQSEFRGDSMEWCAIRLAYCNTLKQEPRDQACPTCHEAERLTRTELDNGRHCRECHKREVKKSRS